jgi:hypothetical protein
VKFLKFVGALGFAIVLTGCNGISPTGPSGASSPRITTPTQVVLVASPGELPIGGGTATIAVAVSAADGQGVENITVALTASAGALESGSVITDRTGHATLTWSGTSSATITGTAGTLVGVGNIPVLVAIAPLPPSVPGGELPPAPVPPSNSDLCSGSHPENCPCPQCPEIAVQLTFTQAGDVVTFTARTERITSAGDIIKIVWSFGDGGSATDEGTSLSDHATKVHTYTGVGTFQASVKVFMSSTTNRSATSADIVIK